MCQQRSRGQVGVGTVVVFISMAMVAAIAAGVLITVGGLLQTEAQETAEASIQQISDRLLVLDVTGSVTDRGTVDTYNFTITKAPGSSDIRIQNLTYEVINSETAETYAVGNVSDKDGIEIIPFHVTTDDQVITDKSDRYILSINATDMGTELNPGKSVVVRFTTESGASTQKVLTAPESLVGRSTAELSGTPSV